MSEGMDPPSVFLLLGKVGWEPPRKTDFRDDGIGIDPAGCGCTDCITGQSYPEDQIDTSVILACLVLGRPIYDRRS